MSWIRTGTVPSVVAMLLSAASLPATAQLTNGGFETGDFTGWVQTGDLGFTGIDSFAARSGSFGAFFGPAAVGGISQALTTSPGTPYQIDFSLSLADSSVPNSFSWTWNGVPQSPSLSNAAGFGYASFSSLVLATGTTASLAFNFSNPASFWLLDNVAVTAIPEVPINALMGVGLLVVAAGVRKRRKRSIRLG